MAHCRIVTSVALASLALAACGTTAHVRPPVHTKSVSYGWTTTKGQSTLTLPYAGVATPSITQLARTDDSYYEQVIKPAYWVYSSVFHRHIFVGPYTSGIDEARVVNSKGYAVVWSEILHLMQAQQTGASWPDILHGFDYQTYASRALVAAVTQDTDAITRALARDHTTAVVSIPSEATIIESPVGTLTAQQMGESPGQPQVTTIGTCVPHAFGIYSAAHVSLIPSSYSAPVAEFFADYGNTRVLLSARASFVSGAKFHATSSCSTLSQGITAQ